MADGCHFENRILAISQRFIVQLMRNLVHRNRIMLNHRLHDQDWNLKNSRLRTAAILNMIISLHFSHDHLILMNFGLQMQILVPGMGHVTGGYVTEL